MDSFKSSQKKSLQYWGKISTVPFLVVYCTFRHELHRTFPQPNRFWQNTKPPRPFHVGKFGNKSFIIVMGQISIVSCFLEADRAKTLRWGLGSWRRKSMSVRTMVVKAANHYGFLDLWGWICSPGCMYFKHSFGQECSGGYFLCNQKAHISRQPPINPMEQWYLRTSTSEICGDQFPFSACCCWEQWSSNRIHLLISYSFRWLDQDIGNETFELNHPWLSVTV